MRAVNIESLLIGAVSIVAGIVPSAANASPLVEEYQLNGRYNPPEAVVPIDLGSLETANWHDQGVLRYRSRTDDKPAEIEPQPAQLLDRIRAGFVMPIIDRPRTVAQRNWYLKHPDYLMRVLNRSRPYLHHIVTEIEQRGMPLELALLPIVESAFDPFAYSHGRAAGLWQIIPGTGRRFGLQQNWWYDGRRDVVASTRAALDYLEFLARRYDGDYELAIAAYNSGEGTVDRAIRRNRNAGKPTTFWDLKLPRETSSYVPKLLALADIVANADLLEVALPVIEDTPRLAQVETGGQIDLALAADLAGLDVETLYRFNPGYNQWATSPDGPHRLALPIEAKPVFEAAIATLGRSERMRWKRHKIANGETLSEIAEQYGVTVATLKSTNNLGSSVIRAGQHLLVPTASAAREAYALSAAARLSRQQNRSRRGVRIEHKVVAGESFWTIAQRYGVSTRALASWNGMAPRDTLSVGKRLVIWTEQTAPATSTTTRRLRYTVRSGDSLARIAARFRVSVSDIARWNNIEIEKILRPGQKLTMFVDVTRQSS